MARAKESDDLLKQLADLEQDASTAVPASQSKPAAAATTTARNPSDPVDGDDAIAALQAQLAAKPAPVSSRPGTPRAGANPVKPRPEQHTPASSSAVASERNSEDRLLRHGAVARSSGEEKSVLVDGRDVEGEKATAGGTGAGGWWSGMGGMLQAAVKQAETFAKEIRGNEEAQRWAEQVRGTMPDLRSFGTDLRTRALPTFTALLSHIAPPISAHERLQIHVTHDIQNYPSLDPLVYSVFSHVMQQVEGGDLLVIQKGSENRSRRTSEPSGYRGGMLGTTGSAGWADGPWWRDEHLVRNLGVVQGLTEGTRLARVSAEAYAKDFFDAKGGVEEAAKQATQTLSDTNPVRSSDIFLAVQAVGYAADAALFASDARDHHHNGSAATAAAAVAEPDSPPEPLVAFALYLHDPIHSLSFAALSQPLPATWAEWLDAASSSPPPGDSALPPSGLPDSIASIIDSGGVDPREWVAEWMQQALELAVGVVAQRYVARRMGVGEGGLGRGKRRVEEDGVGGEAARAI